MTVFLCTHYQNCIGHFCYSYVSQGVYVKNYILNNLSLHFTFEIGYLVPTPEFSLMKMYSVEF